jgi:uncharacterized protein
MRLSAIVVTVCVISVEAGYGASFDCRPIGRAGKCPKTVICSTKMISSLDEQLASLYDSWLNKTPPAQREELKQEQRLWLNERASCQCDASCIEDQYRMRIQQLTEIGNATAQLTIGYDNEALIDSSWEGCKKYVKELTLWDEAVIVRGAKEVCAARRLHLEARERLERSYNRLMRQMAWDRRLDREGAAEHFRTFIKSCIEHKFRLTTGGHNIQIDILPNKIAAACLDLGANMLDHEAAHPYRPW